MSRNILLVEPAYQTKFPPLGLMKISSYHKLLGDNVKFIKGMNENIAYECFWDRIYISTVFTFNWNITIKTIKDYKALVQGDLSRIYVGGIMATLMAKKVWEETGIAPITNVLSKAGILDDDNKQIVDKMIPDYDLFKNSSHQYSLIDDSYFGYSTRGCPRGCDFCGVQKLEPNFIDYRGIKTYIRQIKKLYGEKIHLVLFDNNILASKKLDKIVKDLIDLGFGRNAKYTYKNESGRIIYKDRHVDFNQGIDARLLSEEKIQQLSKLAINPLRIAFDHIKFKKLYSSKIKLAAKYEIKNLSNYILYNHDDTPEDLWNRLKINIQLNKEYGLKIYSFPMKYIPLNAKDRSHINEKNWNWQFLRGVQRILNVVKGIVMPGEEFFHRAFGESPEEFREILYMPEWILMNRGREAGNIEIEWRKAFRRLSDNERGKFLEILISYRGKIKQRDIVNKLSNGKIRNILEFYISQQTKDKQKEAELFN